MEGLQTMNTMRRMRRLAGIRGGRAVLGGLVLVLALLGSSAPHGTAARSVPVVAPQATAVPSAPATGLSVPVVERQMLSVVSQLNGAALSTAQSASLLGQVGRLAAQLQGAEGLQRQLDNKNAALDLLLQAKVDTMASIDKIAADLQINLDQLQVNLDANVNANVDASVGGITLTVKARADEIKADLGAKADRLLVDINADLDVIKVITLHAKAHIDAERLAVTLHALVTKLALDLNAVLKDLKVLAKANVTAALQAEARLRVNITAQVNGVRAQVMAGIDGRISLQQNGIAAATKTLDGILTSVSRSLTAIQSKV